MQGEFYLVEPLHMVHQLMQQGALLPEIIGPPLPRQVNRSLGAIVERLQFQPVGFRRAISLSHFRRCGEVDRRMVGSRQAGLSNDPCDVDGDQTIQFTTSGWDMRQRSSLLSGKRHAGVTIRDQVPVLMNDVLRLHAPRLVKGVQERRQNRHASGCETAICIERRFCRMLAYSNETAPLKIHRLLLAFLTPCRWLRRIHLASRGCVSAAKVPRKTATLRLALRAGRCRYRGGNWACL